MSGLMQDPLNRDRKRHVRHAVQAWSKVRGPTGRNRGGSRGFTLVEMLIAIIITGILAAGVVSLLMSQNEFYGTTDDLVFAEQSLRGAADLVSFEARMTSPGDLAAIGTADADEVTLAMDELEGVVCHVDAGTGQVFFYAYERNLNANLLSGRRVAFLDPLYSGTYTRQNYDPSLTEATGTGDVVATTCALNGGPAVTLDNFDRFYEVSSWGGGTLPADRAIIRIYGTVHYEFKASGFGTGLGLYRNDQELASPFEAGAGFSYVMDDGSVTGNPATLSDVRRIRIDATALGEGSNRHDVAKDLDYDIPLRN